LTMSDSEESSRRSRLLRFFVACRRLRMTVNGESLNLGSNCWLSSLIGLLFLAVHLTPLCLEENLGRIFKGSFHALLWWGTSELLVCVGYNPRRRNTAICVCSRCFKKIKTIYIGEVILSIAIVSFPSQLWAELECTVAVVSGHFHQQWYHPVSWTNARSEPQLPCRLRASNGPLAGDRKNPPLWPPAGVGFTLLENRVQTRRHSTLFFFKLRRNYANSMDHSLHRSPALMQGGCLQVLLRKRWGGPDFFSAAQFYVMLFLKVNPSLNPPMCSD